MRFIIYDDERLFSEALAVLLGRRGHQGVAFPTNQGELTAAVAEVEADVCLFSARETGEPIEALRHLREIAPSLPVVVITEAEAALLRAAQDAGASALCLKVDGIEEIESVLTSASVSGPPLYSRGAQSVARRATPEPRGTSLTPKEHAVLQHLVRGASTAAIAAALDIGEATVRTHLQHLFTKFGVHSRLALVACAVRSDIVDVGTELNTARSA